MRPSQFAYFFATEKLATHVGKAFRLVACQVKAACRQETFIQICGRRIQVACGRVYTH